MKHLYIRLTLSIPEAGTAVHVAELQEAGEQCTMLRVIALNPDNNVAGAAYRHQETSDAQPEMTTVGKIDSPNTTVPHPDTYDNYPDIDAEHLTEDEFYSLWSLARSAFPELPHHD